MSQIHSANGVPADRVVSADAFLRRVREEEDDEEEDEEKPGEDDGSGEISVDIRVCRVMHPANELTAPSASGSSVSKKGCEIHPSRTAGPAGSSEIAADPQSLY
jgi:hypothetical protein